MKKTRIFLGGLMVLFPFLGFGQWFQAGTTWIQENYPCMPSEPVTQSSCWLGANEENPDQPLVYYSSVGDSPLAKIKTEGEKVYFSLIGNDKDEWNLLYDFGLKAGEECTVYSVPIYNNPMRAYKYYCEEVVESNPEFGGWPTLKLCSMSLTDGEIDYFFPGFWIKGLGSVSGLLENYLIGMDGIGAKLLEVSRDGEIIYKDTPASVDTNFELNGIDVKVEGRQIIVTSDNSSSVEVFATDGKKIAETELNGKQASLIIASPGVYVVKVGKQSSKVLIH